MWPHGLCWPGSSVHEISQTRILELVAISFYRDLLDPGIEPIFLIISCIGRQIFYKLCHVGSSKEVKKIEICFYWVKILGSVDHYSSVKRNAIVLFAEMWMNLECVHWEKSEREKQVSYMNTQVWNVEKRYRWTYFQGRNRDTGVENGFMDPRRERGGGMNWEVGLTYIPYHM